MVGIASETVLAFIRQWRLKAPHRALHARRRPQNFQVYSLEYLDDAMTQ